MDKGRFYESIAGKWDALMDQHELSKRLRLVFSGPRPLLGRSDVEDLPTLDAGSGTGHFSKALLGLGARLVSLDVGTGLLSQVRAKCPTRPVQASLLSLPFPDRTFRAILCTEVIEHTADPKAAVRELCRVLAPGGTLALTVPNKRLKFALAAADLLKIRPYGGLENWVGYAELGRWLSDAGVTVERQFGFNLIPLAAFCRPAFDGLDHISPLHPFMVNIAARCRKPEA
ncbi:MAG: methyltransferase domain-containing protein [Elusimicrobia bacterium]|nr:methyltransferase domain-containing protein [Elusimicrobiota bacterium]